MYNFETLLLQMMEKAPADDLEGQSAGEFGQDAVEEILTVQTGGKTDENEADANKEVRLFRDLFNVNS